MNRRFTLRFPRLLVLVLALALLPAHLRAQQYTGMSGLIHVPTADMDTTGQARIGAHFLHKEFIPHVFESYDRRFHTLSYYLSITPFRWLEIGYTCTLLRSRRTANGEDTGNYGLYRKDRYFSAKVQPLRERPGRWWPSVALGMNDLLPWRPEEKITYDPVTGRPPMASNGYFSNYYVAVSKHFTWSGHRLGAHLVYRDWQRKLNDPIDGLVGGITYQPAFQPTLRFMAEYTGCDVNVGFDWHLWKILLLQASLQNGRYFTGGLCLSFNLF